MPLNNFSSIPPVGVEAGEAADRTETSKIEIAKISPTSVVTRRVAEIIRLRWKGYAFVQLDCAERKKAATLRVASTAPSRARKLENADGVSARESIASHASATGF